MFKKLFMNKVWTASALFAISMALYSIDFSIFGNLREISASFLGNLAFLPVYIIVVTLLFERVLRDRERQSVMRKLNMVIGVFFSEFGNRLLKELSEHVVGREELKNRLSMTGSWKKQDFDAALDYLRHSNQKISIDSDALPCLKQFMTNITPDHLDRYAGDLSRYAAAKFRIYANQGAGASNRYPKRRSFCSFSW